MATLLTIVSPKNETFSVCVYFTWSKIQKRVCGPVKKYLTYDNNFWCKNEGYLHQKHIHNSWHWIILCMVYSRNKYWNRHSIIMLSNGNNMNNATTIKTKHFQLKKFWEMEYLIKSYGWTSIKKRKSSNV